jgi:putative glutamine amidotransferase
MKFMFRHGGHTISTMSADRRPTVGLSNYREPASYGVWNQRVDLLPVQYADNLRQAGAIAVLLPPGASDVQADAVAVMDRLDGLVLTGGADIDPARYGAERHETTDPPRTDRDAWEIALVQAAMAAQKPILGVCRGMQVLNVALGGTLIQHLPDVVANHEHRGEIGTFPIHHVQVEAGTALAAAVGERVDVPTHHHQAVDQLAAALVATGWSDDGVVESLTCPGTVWVNGVQWHPEVDGEQSLFRAFVTACRG